MGIGSSLHTIQGWRSQYDRLLRWHERVVHYGATMPSTPKADEYLDFVLAFFLNCYALRDWLQKSQMVSAIDLDTLFRANSDLQICRDICNGSKHFEINKPSIDAKFSIVREYVPDPYYGRLAYPVERLVILAGQHQREIAELVQACLKAWSDFLHARGLVDAAA